jgi:phospholipid N-methyltransferase
MTSRIDLRGGPVVELGAGTGALTRALVERGLPEKGVVAVELNPVFAAGLRKDFPFLKVLEMSAADFPASLPEPAESYQAVVSGLPLRMMTGQQQQEILEAVFSVLSPGRPMYQFTYYPRRPVPAHLLARLGLVCERIGVIWANVPPAGVFRLHRA